MQSITDRRTEIAKVKSREKWQNYIDDNAKPTCTSKNYDKKQVYEVGLEIEASRKHAYIILTPLNLTFI